MQQKQIYCNNCKQMRLFQRPRTSHILHLLITLVLFSVSSFAFGILGFFWIVVWMICAASKGSYRCTQCGEAAKEGHAVVWALLALFVFGGFSMLLKANDLSKKRAAEREVKQATIVTRSIPNDKKLKIQKEIISQKIAEYDSCFPGYSDAVKKELELLLTIKQIEYERINGLNSYTNSQDSALDMSHLIKSVENGEIIGSKESIDNLETKLRELKGE